VGNGIYKVSIKRGKYDALLGKGRAIETDVIVHEHLEKEGITTEIITARAAQALYQYLQNKNLKVEKDLSRF
jgi:deoxyxylulose-5-phosphate synthase